MRGRLRAGPRAITTVLPTTVALVVALASPALGQPEGEPVDVGAFDAPVRFVARGDDTFDVTGELDGRPRGATYPGTLEFLPVPGPAMTAVNDVPMRAYVEGVAEVPVRWPSAALRAQAVAARTYAWYSMRLGSFDSRGYDICATVSCQVYAGREHVSDPSGQRWAEAVAETSDEVLTYDGAPILARYFSTSGGRTRANEEVYPDEGPRPYLKAVPDPEDAVSPLHEWRATFSREDMNAVFARGEQLHAAVPFASIEHVPAGEGRGDRVRVAAEDGSEVVVGASDFRSFVSAVAPDLYPDRYPQRRRDGLRLPETLPSSRFEVTVAADEVVFDGRGFGHGVGMSQYGAMGKALAGMSYDDILAAYYNGLRPGPHPDVPDRIRVGLADDAGRVAVLPDGPARVVAGDRVVTERGMGRWTVVPTADGRVRLVAPAGYGAPLAASPTEVSDATPSEVEVIELTSDVHKPVELFLTVRSADGATVADRSLGVFEEGRRSLTWDLDAGGDQLAPGAYDVSLRAVDETGESAADGARVDIRPVTASGAALPSVLGDVPPADRGVPASLVAAAVAGLLAGFAAGRRMSRERAA